MTVIWLIIWLIQGHPVFWDSWNVWSVSLVICAFVDFYGGSRFS